MAKSSAFDESRSLPTERSIDQQALCRQLQSERFARRMLTHMHKDAADAHLYDSAAKIAASARQCVSYQQAAASADLSVQPLLRYYALLHWLKTILFAVDLGWPSTTTVLQHGVSVRRLKRAPYRWPFETATLFKNGVLQSFWHVVCPDKEHPSRMTIGDLLGTLPSSAIAVGQIYPRFQHAYPLRLMSGIPGSTGYVARAIASNQDLPVDQWRARFLAAHPAALPDNKPHTQFQPDPPGLLTLAVADVNHPWIVHESDHLFVLDGAAPPPWACHCVLLFSLSALARYNPVEWSDIVTWNNEPDAYLVREYLASYSMDAVLASATAACEETWALCSHLT
ncbi:YaaC family protein [Alicyclobacillus contaminans]|uniref:YaaC family protein n=1 Tax=Alicyclobacillus contaminans TaxID=392016 RepID=UPI000A0404E3|nr:YaaC family protein [Alicyclobacillus contaminans]